jgi:hypothetical protein
MYESPIELLFTDIHHQIVEQQDEQIYQAVMHFVPSIDREELLRALKYDRNQYDKGYADGKNDAMAEVVRCKDCKHYDNSEGICWCKLNSKFFPGGMDWHAFPEDGFCSYGERREGE